MFSTLNKLSEKASPDDVIYNGGTNRKLDQNTKKLKFSLFLQVLTCLKQTQKWKNKLFQGSWHLQKSENFDFFVPWSISVITDDGSSKNLLNQFLTVNYKINFYTLSFKHAKKNLLIISNLFFNYSTRELLIHKKLLQKKT